MAATALNQSACFRLPPGVEFLRWKGDDEWVLYHAGTGETIRLSDAASAVLDLFVESDRLDQSAIQHALSAMMDAAPAEQEMQTYVNALLRVLLNHECIEQVS